jgi:hypothetical protein
MPSVMVKARLEHKGYIAVQAVVNKSVYCMMLGPYYLEFRNPEEFVLFVEALDPHIMKLIETQP